MQILLKHKVSRSRVLKHKVSKSSVVTESLEGQAIQLFFHGFIPTPQNTAAIAFSALIPKIGQ
jgi:hypothetical protein